MRRWMTGALVGLVACGAPSGDRPAEPAADVDAAAPATPLASSLSVQVQEDSIRFRLDVTNVGSDPVVLEFPTAQRADFAVADATGAEVWRWSSGMAFAQVLSADTLAAGETRTWQAAWETAAAGEYEATARLTATSHDVALRTAFELPPQ